MVRNLPLDAWWTARQGGVALTGCPTSLPRIPGLTRSAKSATGRLFAKWAGDNGCGPGAGTLRIRPMKE